MIAAHHTMMASAGAPTVFNYICVKYVGYRRLRDYSDILLSCMV